MKIEIRKKDDHAVVRLYDIPDFRTTDLNSGAFPLDGSTVSLDEISGHVPSANGALESDQNANIDQNQVEPSQTTADGSEPLVTPTTSKDEASEIEPRVSIDTVPQQVEVQQDQLEDVQEGVAGTASVATNEPMSSSTIPIEHAVSEESAKGDSLALASTDQVTGSDSNEDLLNRKVGAYLPLDVLRRIEESAVFKSLDEPDVTKLSSSLLFQMILDELCRLHRPPESYVARIFE